MPLHGKSIIAGNPIESTGSTFHAVDPTGNERLDPAFHESDFASVEQALESAEAAFIIYRRSSAEERASLLEEIANEIVALGDELLQRAHRETGLPLDRLTGERGRTVGQLRLFATVVREGSWANARIDLALPERQPIPRPDLRQILTPLGPVIVFGASNFPLAFSVAGGDTASALAAGCPVIVKAHPAHPGTSEMVAGAIGHAVAKRGLPPGIFSMLHGNGPDIGQGLVLHPLARAVGFTGSHQAGRALFDAANARPDPIPVFAEMSSVNPVFILPGALRECGAQIAEGLKGSMTMGVGQFCTKPGLVFAVGGPELQEFTGVLQKAIQATSPGTMLHAGISRSFHKALAATARIPGVISLANSDMEPDKARTQGEPTVFVTDGANFLAREALHEEIFGPCVLLIDAQAPADLLRLAASLKGQLTATVHGTPADLTEAGELIAILERKAGRLLINGFPTGVEVSPAMHHGGPYPATTDGRFTSVGTAAIQRWARPVCYQNFPQETLPIELRNENARGLMRLVNNELTRAGI